MAKKFTKCLVMADLQVELCQYGTDNFTVVYGMQVRNNLDYAAAAAEFGECVMHALACEGRLDNSEKGKRHA